MKRKINRLMIVLAALAAAAMMLSACANNAAKAEPKENAASAQKESSAKPVARIVFVDKENCCQCTAERTAKSWKALEEALAVKTPAIPIERIHFDTQASLAEKYKAMKPIVAVPALYFLDADGGLVGMLQGEVTKAQVESVLKS